MFRSHRFIVRSSRKNGQGDDLAKPSSSLAVSHDRTYEYRPPIILDGMTLVSTTFHYQTDGATEPSPCRVHILITDYPVVQKGEMSLGKIANLH